jgi:hypothetical protein
MLGPASQEYTLPVYPVYADNALRFFSPGIKTLDFFGLFVYHHWRSNAE